MSNTLLTVNQITRKALMILEQKLNFISSINRQYDSSFAQTGAKIGDTLRIRLPNEYVVRDGATLVTQDTKETNTTLQVSTQKGVDLNFTSTDLTMSMDDFSDRIITPAMSVLSASMEADALNMIKDCAFQVGTPGGGSPTDLLTYLNAKAILDNNLAPMDNQRNMLITPSMEAAIVNSLKGLFQDSSSVASQYREGKMGRTGGFDWFTNTLLSSQSIGNMVTGVTLGALPPDGASTLTFAGTVVNGSTFKKGQTFTLANVFAVHPQTKVATTDLAKFVVTEDVTSTGTSVVVKVSPSLILTGNGKNVAQMPTASAAVAFAYTANGLYAQGLAFHKDAFTFATADLVMPGGVDMAARENYQGLSIRLVRAFDINNDKFPCRCDVLYGYKTLRQQLAVRIAS
jgi:hypothetical protein